METTNKFYSIYTSKNNREVFQIRELKAESFRGMDVVFSDGNGNVVGGETFSSPTTSKDYDDVFVSAILELDPPYVVEDFLTFHLSEYNNKLDGDIKLFLKHIQYVILPEIKRVGREELVELISEWLNAQRMLIFPVQSSIKRDDFSPGEIKHIQKSLDELLERFKTVEVGQQILYDDLLDEINELNDLVEKLNKKNWAEIFQGKLMTTVLGKIIDQGLEPLTSILKAKDQIN
ncbi:MAG: hypothetical protein AAGA64_17730 [Bacteroidota bacterium]